jgi:L-fuconolactonase
VGQNPHVALPRKLSAPFRRIEHKFGRLGRSPYPFRDVTVHLKRVFDAYGPQRSYWGTDLTNSYAKASYRQRISHFTEELSFLNESDKDWVMGRAIVQRLKWT